MKNLFNFATKELSQDAFLRWLFESYNDEELQPCVNALLKEFCDIEVNSEDTVKTYAQWQKIDIKVDIQKNTGEKIMLLIEDKAFSGEHDQLKRYNEKLVRYESKGYKIHKVFYKTSLLSQKDIRATKNNGWASYDINSIYKLFNPFENTENIILKQYIEYLYELYSAVNNEIKPKSSDNWIDWLSWISYFEKKIIPNFENKYIAGCEKLAQYPYVNFYLKIEKEMPYFEIRSRDCCNNNFKGYILCYGVKDLTPQDKVINKIKQDNIFKCERLVHRNGGKPKQIGKYEATNIDTDEKFLAEVKRCSEYYSEVMSNWRSNI